MSDNQNALIRVSGLKVYYKDGVETQRTLLWRTTYNSSQKEILYN